MTDTTLHRATPERWAQCKDSAGRWDDATAFHCLLELRARIEALEAGATCPHVVTSDEGTSYCGLAEQQAAEPAPAKPLIVPPLNCRQRLIHEGKPYPKSSCVACGPMSPMWRQCEAAMKVTANPSAASAGSLVEAVVQAMGRAECSWPAEARAAICAVAEWLREHHADGDPVAATALERETRR